MFVRVVVLSSVFVSLCPFSPSLRSVVFLTKRDKRGTDDTNDDNSVCNRNKNFVNSIDPNYFFYYYNYRYRQS